MPSKDFEKNNKAIEEINKLENIVDIQKFVWEDNRPEIQKFAEEKITELYGKKLGDMYKRWVLDCIIDLAYRVAFDFSERLELYQDVDPNIAKLISELQAFYGYHPSFPNKEIRTNTLMKPIFGVSDWEESGNDRSEYKEDRFKLILAAADSAYNYHYKGYEGLLESVRSALVPQRQHFWGFEGTSLYQTEERTKKLFEDSVKIITDEAIRIVFGIKRDIGENWPMDLDDTQGEKLVERISQQLPGLPFGEIKRQKFARKRRVAEKGAKSIKWIINPELETNDDKLIEAIRQFTAWGVDLGILTKKVAPNPPINSSGRIT